jgi:hypothetical protein
MYLTNGLAQHSMFDSIPETAHVSDKDLRTRFDLSLVSKVKFLDVSGIEALLILGGTQPDT